jgi:uncharacterized protein YjgD (DUF1641 family)
MNETTTAVLDRAPEMPEANDRLARLEEKLDQIIGTSNRIRRQQEMLEELKEDLMPMANGMIYMTSAKLQAMEADGSLDEVKALAESAPELLALLGQLSRPEVLALAGGAVEGLGSAKDAKPLGLMGVMGAMKDPDVKKGMGVAIELLRGLGKAAR